MDTPIKTKRVIDRRTYTLSITLFEYGGTVRAKWALPGNIQPHWAMLELDLGDKPAPRANPHTIESATGEHDFGVNWGRGFRLRLTAENFSRQRINILRTDQSKDATGKLPASISYDYELILQNSNNQAQIVLTTTPKPAFRPRPPTEVYLLEQGQERFKVELKDATATLDTKVRWGVELEAGLRAHAYDRAFKDILRTDKTKG